jgi:DNA-binding transcriptional ArsR family regulator
MGVRQGVWLSFFESAHLRSPGLRDVSRNSLASQFVLWNSLAMKPHRSPLAAKSPQAGIKPLTLAMVGSLIGDPVRAAILLELSDGSRRPASELAFLAGASPQAASAHLSRLVEGGLLQVENQGRHRFFSLPSGDVAEMIEGLANWADRRPRLRHHDPALCKARLCYDHLAGRLGVAVFDRLAAQGWLSLGVEGPAFTLAGLDWCRRHELEAAPPSRTRPLLRLCLDWTERRHHLGGHFGAIFARRLLDKNYLRRHAGQRIVEITPLGADFLRRELAIDLIG